MGCSLAGGVQMLQKGRARPISARPAETANGLISPDAPWIYRHGAWKTTDVPGQRPRDVSTDMLVHGRAMTGKVSTLAMACCLIAEQQQGERIIDRASFSTDHRFKRHRDAAIGHQGATIDRMTRNT